MRKNKRYRTAAAVLAILMSSAYAQGIELNVGVGNSNVGVSIGSGGVDAGVHVDTPAGSVEGGVHVAPHDGIDAQGLFERNRPPPDPATELLKLGEPTIRLLVGNLSDEDRRKLKVECKKVLADPVGFSSDLVALCMIVEGRLP